MNKFYFSSETNSFYPSDMKEDYQIAGSWPDDAFEIDDEIASKYMENPPDGKTRGINKDGYPVWIDLPKPSKDMEISRNEALRSSQLNGATQKIAPLQDAVDLNDATDEEKSKLLEWKKYRVALMRVDTSDPVWPEAPES